MHLQWHHYRYYPYERGLALREAQSVLRPSSIREDDDGICVEKPTAPDDVVRLVYFATATHDATQTVATHQSILERANGNGLNRQATRYSVHGLHEYKGKFNPQVAKALLNIFSADRGDCVLDPFCGSGTSLVECAQLGIKAVGTDVNPLAVFLANAKLKSLGIRAGDLKGAIAGARRRMAGSRSSPPKDDRTAYLQSWFSPGILEVIESVRSAFESLDGDAGQIGLAIASNLLRDYSLQEPRDLRIRRRKSALPEISFLNALERAVEAYCSRLGSAQETLGVASSAGCAIHLDCRELSGSRIEMPGAFDLAITSPPYATALPYIDTQRLSLVWLGLLKPEEVLDLEASLVGSREIRGGRRKDLLIALETNAAQIPAAEQDFCIRLQGALGKDDGFRRVAVPRLLYRYFAAMADSFTAVRRLMKPNAPFALIVGRNHTVLGGKRFQVDTPAHLASIAVSRGWRHQETMELQTYRRFGLHRSNATSSEALVILRA
ncbi:MAG TPA: DNA methyltransferase [Steroidobacteraceae bacterium]|jgi:site-specific DNA-methyltransferase (cytosine-N4-specific)